MRDLETKERPAVLEGGEMIADEASMSSTCQSDDNTRSRAREMLARE